MGEYGVSYSIQKLDTDHILIIKDVINVTLQTSADQGGLKNCFKQLDLDDCKKFLDKFWNLAKCEQDSFATSMQSWHGSWFSVSWLFTLLQNHSGYVCFRWQWKPSYTRWWAAKRNFKWCLSSLCLLSWVGPLDVFACAKCWGLASTASEKLCPWRLTFELAPVKGNDMQLPNLWVHSWVYCTMVWPRHCLIGGFFQNWISVTHWSQSLYNII